MEPEYTRSPHTLLNSVFYLNGKNFCLRRGEEHRKLKVSQLQRLSQPDRYPYHENCSKDRAGRSFPSTALALLTIKDAMSTYWTFICQSYRQQLLQRRVLSTSVHCLQYHSSPWYTRTPVGRNMLASMLKKMCLRGGIEGCKTNHSLHATGATQLFHAEVPEKSYRSELAIVPWQT